MTRATLETREERRHFAEASDARNREVLDPHTANAIAKINRDKEARGKRFANYRNTIATDDFEAFLVEDGLRLESAWPELPYDEGAEMAVIGAICMDPATVEMAIGPLHPRHFRLQETCHVIRAVAALRQQQRQKKVAPIDVTTIASEMRRQKTFWPRAGDFLMDCIESCACSENISAYIEAVMNASQLRYQHYLAESFSRAALAPEANPAHLTYSLRTALDKIEASGWCDMESLFETPK